MAPTAPVAASVHAPPIVVAEAPPDVSPVPAPGGLGFTVHLAHPRATFQQLSSVLGSLAAMFAGVAKVDPESLVALVVGAPIGAVLDLDQPIDVAVSDVDATEGSPKIAGAVVLSDPVAAREVLEKYYRPIQTAPGVIRLEPRDDAPDGASPRPCMLAPAPGPDATAPRTTRLVCGEDVDAVRHLGPYLARTMSRLASRDDLRVELFVRELRGQSGKKELTPGGGAAVDGGVVDPTDKLFDDLTEKLTDDVGSVVLEASSDGTAVDVRLSTKLVGTASPLTRAVVGAGTPVLPLPAAFDRLPRDASFAWYGRGATPADLAPLRASLFDSLRTWLADDGYAPGAIDTQLAPFERLALSGGPWSLASGLRVDAARAALDAYAAAGKTTEGARAKARAAMQGWIVAAVEEPSQGWIDGVRELVKNDPVKPTGKPRRKRAPSKESTRLVLTPVPPGLPLPAGTLHMEAHVTQNPEWTLAQKKAGAPLTDAVIPHTMHFFVVPDGGRTWLAAAEDPALAASEVRGSLSGAGDAGTLKTRHDFDALRTMPASTAGFVTVASLATWLHSDWSDDGLRKLRETLLGLASLNDQGTTSVPVALAATRAASGPGGEVRVRFVLPIWVGLEVAASPHSIF